VFTSLPPPWRVGAAVLITGLGVRYLPWRLSHTLNLSTPLAALFSVLLLAAELILLFHGFVQVWLSGLGGCDGRREIEEAATQLEADRQASPERLLSVAVLVPTFGEPLDLIARCLRGALALDYPRHEVWLLDDSQRQELRDLASHLGCRYLARADRRFAKAGNLNHALPHVTADLIAVFDADVVPLSNFLSRTVGLFADPSVGFVQTPQTYMAADPLMRNLRLEHWLMADEESFYRWIEPNRQRVGAVVCAGTSFVMRREALSYVGNFETGTTSEDLATGIRLVAAGYRGLYLPEKLSAGLAPLTIGAMVVQRCRWASGTLQTLRTSANPLTIAGLNPLQRVAYMEGVVLWLLVFPFLMLVVTPPLLGLVNLAPLRVEPKGLLQVAIPFYASQMLLIRWLSNQSRSAFSPELYRWVLAYPLAKTVWATLMGRPVQFRVTPKGNGFREEAGANGPLMRPLLVVLGVQLVALTQLIRQLLEGWQGSTPLTGERTTTLLFAFVWIVPTIVLLLVAIRSCWDRPREDAIPWLAPQLGGWLVGPNGSLEAPLRVLAISEQGCEVALRRSQALWESLDHATDSCSGTWCLQLDDPLLGEDLWPAQMVCRRARGPARRAVGIGLRWGPLQEAQQELLERYLYRRPGLWPTCRAPWDGLALAAVVYRLVQQVEPEGWFRRSLLPIR